MTRRSPGGLSRIPETKLCQVELQRPRLQTSFKLLSCWGRAFSTSAPPVRRSGLSRALSDISNNFCLIRIRHDQERRPGLEGLILKTVKPEIEGAGRLRSPQSRRTWPGRRAAVSAARCATDGGRRGPTENKNSRGYSSGSAPAWQAPGPKFDSRYQKKKREHNRREQRGRRPPVPTAGTPSPRGCRSRQKEARRSCRRRLRSSS